MLSESSPSAHNRLTERGPLKQSAANSRLCSKTPTKPAAAHSRSCCKLRGESRQANTVEAFQSHWLSDAWVCDNHERRACPGGWQTALHRQVASRVSCRQSGKDFSLRATIHAPTL